MRLLGRALLMIVALIAGSMSASAWWITGRAASAWPIVVQRADGNLAFANEHGRSWPLTTDADGQRLFYLHPTPAPNGRSVAMVAVRHTTTGASAALVVAGLDGQRTTLYDQPDSSPFYLAWSPDSQKIAFLANSTSGMTLHAVPAGGQQQAKQIAPGQPSYFSWSPDSQRLLLHIGGSTPTGSLQLYEWNAAEPRRLSAQPALFQAPVWLPDGNRAFVIVRQPATPGAALALIDAEGNVLQRLADVSNSTVFVSAPDAAHLAYLSLNDEQAGRLHLLRADGSGHQRIEVALVVTCLWSPTSDALAFLSIVPPNEKQTVAQTQPTLHLRWNVLNLRDGDVRSFDPFQPSTEFVNMLLFFDQYAQSVRLWNRGGTRLLYVDGDGVYALDVKSGQTQRVASGVLGFWMEP